VLAVHLADWLEVGNGQTGLIFDEDQGPKGNGQTFEPCRVRQKVALRWRSAVFRNSCCSASIKPLLRRAGAPTLILLAVKAAER